MTRRLAALLALLVPSLAHAQISFRADRARLSPGRLTLENAYANVGSVVIEAGSLDRCSPGLRGTDVSVRPCGCVPIGLSARAVTLHEPDALTLDSPSLRLGGVRIPFAPRWWVVWGERVGLLLPRVSYRDGLSVGPGVHLPLGRGRSMDAWVLARTDGAELQATLRAGGALDVDARVTTHEVFFAARGSLASTRGATVFAVRADGATSARGGALFARSPSEWLRPASEAAVGVSVQRGLIAASDVELTRVGDDLAARAVLSVAAPTLAYRRSALSLRAWTATSLGPSPTVFHDAELHAQTAAMLGPLDLHAGVRAEGLWRSLDRSAVARALATVALPLRRRGASVSHRVYTSATVGAEGGDAGSRAMLGARVESTLVGARWRWSLAARATLSSDATLPPRLELANSLLLRSIQATAAWTFDQGTAVAELRGAMRDARGDSLSLGASYRARSAWDALPSWEEGGDGPMDLQGVRARRRLGATARASLTLALFAGLSMAAEAYADVLRPAVVLVAYGLGWRARCGCASVALQGAWSELVGPTAMLSVGATP